MVPQVDRGDRPRAAVGAGPSAVSRPVGGAQPGHGIAVAAQIRGHVFGAGRCLQPMLRLHRAVFSQLLGP